jgi:hypothetical protein
MSGFLSHPAGRASGSNVPVAPDRYDGSAPAHVAGAVGTPVVQIYGASVLSMGYGPLDPRSRIVQVDLPCRPCGAHHENRCPAGHFRCMRDITPGMVLAVAREVMHGLAMVGTGETQSVRSKT